MPVEDPDAFRVVETSAPLPLEVRDFALAQLALDQTVEDPAVVWRGNILKLAQLCFLLRPFSGVHYPASTSPLAAQFLIDIEAGYSHLPQVRQPAPGFLPHHRSFRDGHIFLRQKMEAVFHFIFANGPLDVFQCRTRLIVVEQLPGQIITVVWVLHTENAPLSACRNSPISYCPASHRDAAGY